MNCTPHGKQQPGLDSINSLGTDAPPYGASASVAIRGCATSWRININYRFLKLYAPEVCGFVSVVSITSYLCSSRVSWM